VPLCVKVKLCSDPRSRELSRLNVCFTYGFTCVSPNLHSHAPHCWERALLDQSSLPVVCLQTIYLMQRQRERALRLCSNVLRGVLSSSTWSASASAASTATRVGLVSTSLETLQRRALHTTSSPAAIAAHLVRISCPVCCCWMPGAAPALIGDVPTPHACTQLGSGGWPAPTAAGRRGHMSALSHSSSGGAGRRWRSRTARQQPGGLCTQQHPTQQQGRRWRSRRRAR
jgi:hypothetical protein